MIESMNHMKTWLQKFRVSNALNEGHLPPSQREPALQPISEVDSFRDECQALAEALKARPSQREFPPALHNSIMRAIRTSSRAGESEGWAWWPRWQKAAGIMMLVWMGAFLTFHHVPRKVQPQLAPASPSLALASSAWELAGNFVRQAPASALSPIVDEKASLDRDLARAGEFLYASLP